MHPLDNFGLDVPPLAWGIGSCLSWLESPSSSSSFFAEVIFRRASTSTVEQLGPYEMRVKVSFEAYSSQDSGGISDLAQNPRF